MPTEYCTMYIFFTPYCTLYCKIYYLYTTCVYLPSKVTGKGLRMEVYHGSHLRIRPIQRIPWFSIAVHDFLIARDPVDWCLLFQIHHHYTLSLRLFAESPATTGEFLLFPSGPCQLSNRRVDVSVDGYYRLFAFGLL